MWDKPTLSHSIFCLVSGSARLRPLNALSLIWWYASFNDDCNRVSSASMSANILFAAALGDAFMIAGGIGIKVSCDVSSWTCIWMSLSVVFGNCSYISLFIVVNVDEDFALDRL